MGRFSRPVEHLVLRLLFAEACDPSGNFAVRSPVVLGWRSRLRQAHASKAAAGEAQPRDRLRHHLPPSS